MDLSDYRVEIDKIDKEMIKLFEKRMAAVKGVGEYKKEKNIPILNEERERQVIDKNLSMISDDLKVEGKDFLEALMSVSRSYQDKLINKNENIVNKVVGYPGVRGSFCHQALIQYFGTEESSRNYEDFEDVFMALKNKDIDYGVVPIENSSTGAISKVYDLLRNYGFFIVGEQYVHIDQNLIGLKGTEITDIKEVYSHTQGFEQSSRFLDTHKDWKLIPHYNTATSVKYIKDMNDTHKAAIASKEAASIYDMSIIKEGINDNRNNTTRFVIISREIEKSKKNDKISIIFSLKHEAGTLYNVLKYFADNNLNLLKIESRPREESNWEYFFYIDFAGNIEDNNVIEAIEKLKLKSSYYRLIGSYKAKLLK